MLENGDRLILDEVMTLKELQTYQDMFCEAQRIYLKCYNSKGVPLTKLSGRKEDKEILYDIFEKKYLIDLIDSNAKKSLSLPKTCFIDTLYKNILIFVAPNIIDGIHQGIWAGIIVYRTSEYSQTTVGLFNESKMYGTVTKNGSERALKLLRMLTNKFISTAFDNTKNVQKLKEIKEKEDRIKEELHRKETTNKILELLEKENEFHKNLNSVLKEISEYLMISASFISRLNEKSEIEIMGRWSKENASLEFIEDELSYEIIINESNETILIIEPDEEDIRLRNILNRCKIKSLISIPILVGKEPAIYAVFVEKEQDRFWDSNTVRFLFDVCKLIQNTLFKKISKDSLVNSYTALKEILNNLGSGIFVIDKSTRKILFCNDIISKMSGKDMVGKHCYDFHYGGVITPCKYCIPLKHKKYFLEKYDEKLERWYEITYNDIIWVDGREVSLCNVTDVTDKKKYQQRIEFQANNDFLTGLFNRMRCEEDLQVCVREAIDTKSKGALLFIDLDDFKHINDGLGHQYGDMLLKMISVGLQHIKGIENRCYRVGGDEFIIIVEPVKYNMLDLIIAEIRKLFSKPWYLSEAEYYCTMSMGIVSFADNGKDVNDLIKKADIAMYDAKKSGKNRYVFYNKGEDKSSYIKLDIEKNMRLAVASSCREFEVYIQPIVDAATETCIGGEALVRWNSSKLGFLNPTEFIPLAEHLGLITPIGEYILKQSCELNRRWSDKGINIRINVNLSIIQLLDNGVVETISQIISSSGVNPNNLVLEVTESLAINDMNRMKKIIKDIKALGVKIALDDFGTGYSSLNYIKEMELDIIKVDRTFIKDIATDEYAKAFVKLIAELSEKLEVQVCVEGVEEKDQLDVLKELNISMIQGYYFGKPMKIREFEEKFL